MRDRRSTEPQSGELNRWRCEPRSYGMSKFLITLGVVLVLAGLLWPVLQKSGLGRLPGDFVIQRENMTIYIPLATSLLVSLVLSLILWFIGR